MNRNPLCVLLLCAVSQISFGAPATPAPGDAISRERLARVYVLLTNARQMASAGVLPTEADVLKTAESLSRADLKKECIGLVDACVSVLASTPRDNRPDTFAYMKNAKARLMYNREDPHGGHTTWATGAGPQKTNNATRDIAAEIKKTLSKL